jgi:glutamate-1-semialdehyde 2,1-aminomutase
MAFADFAPSAGWAASVWPDAAPAYDLRPGQPDPTIFPHAAWMRSGRQVLAKAPPDLHRRGDAGGRPELRAALAAYLGRARGVLTSPDQIVITTGYSQSLGLLARVLADSGATAIIMEDPGLPFHREIVSRAGLRIIPLPVDVLGARTDLLTSARFAGAAAVHVTPAHQYPTGATLHPDRRRALISWAAATGGLVIEDDYDGEFRYDRQPVGAVQGMAPASVAYGGTASKALSPALRLGWMALPEHLLPAISDAKRHADTHTASLSQLVLADLIESQIYDRHIRSARMHYRRRRDLLLGRLHALAPQVQVNGVAAGLHALVKLPADGPAEGEVVDRALARGLALQPLAGHWYRSGEHQQGLIVGYSTPPEQVWPEALEALCAVLHGLSIDHERGRPMSSANPQRLDEAVGEARARYAQRRPRSRALQDKAQGFLPGGNTRSVLYHQPFPLRVDSGWDAILRDVDGHEYVDLLGEYSAGLYGHSHPVIVKAMTEALAEGISRGAHTSIEVDLAEAVCARFGSIERVRFTNSGTEANLLAITAARAFTGRDCIVVFGGGYHGSVLTFKGGRSPVNAPYDVLLADYNDAGGARSLIEDQYAKIAGVLVEPMLGSGGCIPADPAFLAALREATKQTGALLIFDEVMTSRTGAGGLQGRLGITPDLTTLGKYIGGGSSFGAFGGRADVMELFDPARPDALPHAGTFNNNVLSMAAGYAGLTRVYPPQVAEQHTARGDKLRDDLTAVFRSAGAPFTVTGVGTLLNIHPTASAVRSPADLADAEPRLLELLFLDLLELGYYIAPRGYLALSLAVTSAQLDGFLQAVAAALAARAALIGSG